jgi:hypothetical protein
VLITFFRKVKEESGHIEPVDVAERLAESLPIYEESDTQPHSASNLKPAGKPTGSPPSKILATLGVRQLLDQINKHFLDESGQITTGKGAIRITWSDQENESVTRSIMVRVQSAETLLINGRPFPATRQGAKEGLVSCLKGINTE